MEDFTTYTEHDDGGDLTVTSSKCDVLTIDRNDKCAVVKDFGASHFDDFEHLIEAMFQTSDDYGLAIIEGLTNNSGQISIEEFDRIGNEGICSIVHHPSASGNDILFEVKDFNGNISDWDGYGSKYLKDTWYYLKLVRSGTTFTLYIYSDSARTTLIDSISITSSTSDPYRHLVVSSNKDDWYNNTNVYSWEIQNLDLQEAPPAGGGSMQLIKHWGGV